MVLPITLCMAAASAVLNIWLTIRIAQVRAREKVFVGDAGNDAVIRRMRAQANFIENAPLTLILVAVIELAGKGGAWLPVVAAVFVIGRIAHAFGMDGSFKAGRAIGSVTAMLSQLGLAVVAVLVAVGTL